MTKDEILKIKEHIEIHARREHRAIIITEILWKAVDELEHIKELKKENKQLKQQIEKMKRCYLCKSVYNCAFADVFNFHCCDKMEVSKITKEEIVE